MCGTNGEFSGNLIRKLYPSYYTSGVLPIGNPDVPGEVDVVHSTRKGTGILGIDYVGMDKIAGDTLAYFRARGWLEKRYNRDEHRSVNMLVK